MTKNLKLFDERDFASLESALVNAFVNPYKRAQYESLLRGRPRKRGKILSKLDHWYDEDARYSSCVRSTVNVHELLVRLGAPSVCHLISADEDLDGRIMDLGEAISAVELAMRGALIGCVPGRLAFFIGEPPENRLLLKR